MENDPKSLEVRPGSPSGEGAIIAKGSVGSHDRGGHPPSASDGRPPNLPVIAAVLGPTVLGLAQHEPTVAMGLLAVMGLILLAYNRR